MADDYKLVSLNEVKEHLDLDLEDQVPDRRLSSIRDAVEALLAEQTGKVFGPAEAAIVEDIDGTDTQSIWTTRPIGELTSIEINDGYAESDAYVTPLDVTQDCRVDNQRRIRTRSWRFPCGVKNIRVTYDSDAYQPAIAKEAVLELIAIIWRRRGSEEARSEQLGTFTHVFMRDVMKESTMWRLAVDALHTGQRMG
jgi:hypothetical protein